MVDLKKNKSIPLQTVKIALVLCCVFMSSCISITASDKTDLLLDAKYDKYYAFHNVSLVNTDIFQELVVNGKIKSSNSRLHKVTINGIATFDNTVIKQDISMNGKVTLNKSVVKHDIIGHGELILNDSRANKIEIEATKLILNNTTVNAILLKKYKNTVVYIRNGSKVTGNIIFASGVGSVVIDPLSKVKGHITSGIVKQENLHVNIGRKFKANNHN